MCRGYCTFCNEAFLLRYNCNIPCICDAVSFHPLYMWCSFISSTRIHFTTPASTIGDVWQSTGDNYIGATAWKDGATASEPEGNLRLFFHMQSIPSMRPCCCQPNEAWPKWWPWRWNIGTGMSDPLKSPPTPVAWVHKHLKFSIETHAVWGQAQMCTTITRTNYLVEVWKMQVRTNHTLISSCLASSVEHQPKTRSS